MRSLVITLLAFAGLCLAAAQAGAYDITMTARGAIDSLASSDTVIVDVFLDAEPGLTLLSVGVLYPDDGTIVYDGPATAALTPVTATGNGSFPQYILYSPSGMIGMPATLLYPVPPDFWRNWTGILPPGKLQVNIDYAEAGFNAAVASGTGIYIGTLLFHIASGFSGADLELCITCGGNTVQIGGQTSPEIIDPSLVGLSAPIALTAPEPAVASLAAVAVGLVAFARGRKRRA